MKRRSTDCARSARYKERFAPLRLPAALRSNTALASDDDLKRDGPEGGLA